MLVPNFEEVFVRRVRFSSRIRTGFLVVVPGPLKKMMKEKESKDKSIGHVTRKWTRGSTLWTSKYQVYPA